MLERLGSNHSYVHSEPGLGSDQSSSPNFNHYINILKRRFFYFLVPFGLISIFGFTFAAIQKPDYLSEGKILVEPQAIALDIVKPVLSATAGQRIHLIQQQVTTRDNLLSVAAKFGLFPRQSRVLDLMRDSLQIKPVEIVGQSLQYNPAIAFTVGFQYENPEIAMRVANDFVTSIIGEDSRSRTSRSTEAVKIFSDETKEIEAKVESTQRQISEIEQQPEAPTQQKSQLAALAAIKGELIQKMSVYSDAHPAVTALKKRIAAMEKTIARETPAQGQPAPADDIEALKRNREALEKRLAEAHAKLAAARLSEKLEQDQQSERLQIIELPSLPQKPLKSNRLKIVGIALVAAIVLGVGSAIAPELVDGSIRDSHQLSAVVAASLITSIPYITTRSDLIWRRLRILFSVTSVIVLLTILAGLTIAIVLHLPLDFFWDAGVGLHIFGQ